MIEQCERCGGDGYLVEPECCGHWVADCTPHGEVIVGTERCCGEPKGVQIPCPDCSEIQP